MGAQLSLIKFNKNLLNLVFLGYLIDLLNIVFSNALTFEVSDKMDDFDLG